MDIKRDEYRKANPSFLQKFISQHEDMNWDWNSLSKNPNITIEFILSTDYPWHFWFVSDNPNVRACHILQRPEEHWELTTAIKHVDCSDIFEYPEICWPIDHIPKNRKLTKENIAKNYSYKDNWWFLSLNKNLHMNYYAHENPKKPWPWMLLSIHPTATLKYITTHLDLPWRWDAMHANPNITEKFVLNNSGLDWYWNGLSSSKNISIEFILKCPHLPWVSGGVSANPNLTLEKMLEFKDDYNWIYENIAINPGIIPDSVVDCLTSSNPRLKKIAEKIMCYDLKLMTNPSITKRFVEHMFETYPNSRDKYAFELSSNILLYDDTVCDRALSKELISKILQERMEKDVADLTGSYCFNIFKNIA